MRGFLSPRIFVSKDVIHFWLQDPWPASQPGHFEQDHIGDWVIALFPLKRPTMIDAPTVLLDKTPDAEYQNVIERNIRAFKDTGKDRAAENWQYLLTRLNMRTAVPLAAQSQN